MLRAKKNSQDHDLKRLGCVSNLRASLMLATAIFFGTFPKASSLSILKPKKGEKHEAV